MIDLASPYPPRAYLLRDEGRLRLRFRDQKGRIDLAAARRVAKLLPRLRDIAPVEKDRLVKFIDRAINAGEVLDERFGIPIVVEVPEGGVRQGVGPDGEPWKRALEGAAYGFLPDTVARDEEPLDVLLGPDPSAPMAFIVTQVREDGMIDEYKILLGFESADAAEACYLANWPPALFGGMGEMPIEVLRGLLDAEAPVAGATAKAIRLLAAGGAVMVVSEALVVAQLAPARKRAPSLPPESVGYYDGPEAEAVEPTDHRCPLCGSPWTPDDVRTVSLMALEGEAVGFSLFYRMHRTCAERASADAIAALDEQAMAHAAEGRLLGQGTPKIIAKGRARKLSSNGTDLPRPLAEVQLLPVEKGLDASTPRGRRIVYGVVLEPEPFDGAGDAHGETYTAELIEKAAHDYLSFFANIDDSHGPFLGPDKITIVESFIAPLDFERGGTKIRHGSWVLAARIVDDELWGRVLRGELKAWSIEGFAERECTTCSSLMRGVRTANGQLEWACPRCSGARGLLMPHV